MYRFPRYWSGIITIAATVVLSANARATRADLLQKFMDEYPAAADRLDAAYSQVRITATQTANDDQGRFLYKAKTEFLRQDSAVRAVRTYLESSNARMPAGSVFASGGDASTYFEMDKMPGDAAFRFLWYGKKSDYISAIHMECLPLFGAYCVMDESMADYIKREGLSVISASPAR